MIKAKFCVCPPCLRPPEGPYWCNSPGWGLWGYLRSSFPKHPFGHSEQLTTCEWLCWASWSWFPSTGSLCPSLGVGWGSPAALHLQNQGWAQGHSGAFCSAFPRAPPLLQGLHKCLRKCLCLFSVPIYSWMPPEYSSKPSKEPRALSLSLYSLSSWLLLWITKCPFPCSQLTALSPVSSPFLPLFLLNSWQEALSFLTSSHFCQVTLWVISPNK